MMRRNIRFFHVYGIQPFDTSLSLKEKRLKNPFTSNYT